MDRLPRKKASDIVHDSWVKAIRLKPSDSIRRLLWHLQGWHISTHRHDQLGFLCGPKRELQVKNPTRKARWMEYDLVKDYFL